MAMITGTIFRQELTDCSDLRFAIRRTEPSRAAGWLRRFLARRETSRTARGPQRRHWLPARVLHWGSALLLGLAAGLPLAAPAHAGLEFDPASVTVNEDGGTATYTVKLAAEPSASVTVAVSSGDTAVATISPASVTLTSSDWSTGANVTVTGVNDDSDNEDDKRMVTLSHSASSTDSNYDGKTGTVSVDVSDDDEAPGQPVTGDLNLGHKEVELLWSAPTDTGTSPITGYDVEYKPSGGAWTDAGHTGLEGKLLIAVTNNITYQVRVRAENNAGKGAWANPLWFNTGPMQVTNLSLTPGSERLSASWTRPVGIYGTYDVEYRESGASAWTDAGHEGNFLQTSHTITGLTNGTQYQVRVRARDGGARAKWSDTATGTPAPSAPAVPTNLWATTEDKQTTVRWTAAVEATSHEIRNGTNSGDGTWTAVTGITEYSITGLTNGTTYYIQVRGKNATGDGPHVETTVTPEVPSLPAAPTKLAVETTPDGEARVDWTNAAGAGSHEYKYGVESGDGAWRTIPSKPTILRGLANGTTYYIQVRGRNAAGVGPHAEVSTEPVGWVTGLALTAGNGQIEAAWNAPPGTVTGYDVEYKKTGSNGKYVDAGHTGTNAAHTITGLDNDGSKYRVRVRAVNADGNGTWSYRSAALGAPQQPPPVPTNVSVTGDNQQLRLSWTAPYSDSPVTDYDVQYRDYPEPWTDWDHTGTAAQTTITGLTNGTYYHLRVRASNAQGASGWTTPVAGYPQPQGVPAQVTGLTLTPGNGQIEATWNAPAGSVTGYGVTYMECCSGTRMDAGHTGTDTSITITGLDNNGSDYFVWVRAKNANGDGGEIGKRAALGAPQKPPPAPTNRSLKAGNQQIEVSWTAP